MALAGALLCALGACGPQDPTPPRPRVVQSPSTLRPVPEAATAPPPPVAVPTPDEGRCAPPPAPVVGAHWQLRGYRPGPVLRDVLATGRFHNALVAVTAREVCVSDDWGATWAPRLGADVALKSPEVVALPGMDAVVVIAQGTASEPAPPTVHVSRDEGEHWEPLAMPRGADGHVRVFTDRERAVWAVSGARLWWSDDGRAWQGPHRLPSDEADHVDACGATLIARVPVGQEHYFHRSEDRGATWRAFRLGQLGVEGGEAVVRCLGWRGGLEAGRGPLPSHWSFDAGRTWERALYDETARRAARSLAEDPRYAADPPHCAAAPHGELTCMDARRLVLPDPRYRRSEVLAPAACERVRMLDDRRVMAFGPSCGVFLSTDRGGLWHAVSVAVDPSRARQHGAAGRGGFVSSNEAWRVDDGLWWTEDGGARWRLVLTTQTRALEWGVFTDARHGVFARGDGWVASTRDGGEAWTWVLHEEIERLASSGPWLMLTTAARVRVSPDGGETWRASLPFPQNLRLDPVLQASGAQRWVEPAPGVRVSQRDDRVEVLARGAPAAEVVRGLPRGWDMLATHATNGQVDRVLLAGGAVLRRDATRASAGRLEASARRTPRRTP